jgi:hypothetical protein
MQSAYIGCISECIDIMGTSLLLTDLITRRWMDMIPDIIPEPSIIMWTGGRRKL